MEKRNPTGVFALFLLIGFLLLPAKIFGEVFEFRHVAGARYRIISVVDQAVFINGVLSHRGEILNRIAVEITDVVNGTGMHRATFQTSERILYDWHEPLQGTITGFQWSREYESIFERDRLGNMTIDSQFYMPVVRNVPVFPDRPLRIGDRWHAPAHEVHDFRYSFGIPDPYRIDFNAFYEFVGFRQWKGVHYPAFSVNYNIETQPPPVRGRIYPVRISGTFNQLVFWDHSLGQAVAYEETFRITFWMSDGRRIEYRGSAHAEVVESEYMDRDRMIAEIAEEIDRLQLADVYVRAVEEGVVISLENIQFFPDSVRMLPGGQETLTRLAGILLLYPDRDIMVSGHAALIGTREYLMQLSLDRAGAVAEYLLSRNIRSADRIVIRGYGAERPIADNNTEEGMRRNRRVEITLLEN